MSLPTILYYVDRHTDENEKVLADLKQLDGAYECGPALVEDFVAAEVARSREQAEAKAVKKLLREDDRVKEEFAKMVDALKEGLGDPERSFRRKDVNRILDIDYRKTKDFIATAKAAAWIWEDDGDFRFCDTSEAMVDALDLKIREAQNSIKVFEAMRKALR